MQILSWGNILNSESLTLTPWIFWCFDAPSTGHEAIDDTSLPKLAFTSWRVTDGG